ncbi:hypothetical protein BU26DRAFT_514316 [Trematosphaeria pertusa]|uniref:Heterokaryon incompatibility domain-containing protein n=1 Tax=Trematosphaeria pertusa TaxID=390896 RepID=A0A6A6IVJ2_9PLEO|nr:uncharacterized protein BU26DRAFT_514316 [Trematosphaeria pertusa]KAF2254396.1 hypothetical protein BU26DRAFT_514316 [Trematosphaeria pertusa]
MSPEEPISCEIIHVNLHDDPEYAAFSYNWATEDGDDSKSRLVHCLGGTGIPVTVNCEAGLRQVGERRLWEPGLGQNPHILIDLEPNVSAM